MAFGVVFHAPFLAVAWLVRRADLLHVGAPIIEARERERERESEREGRERERESEGGREGGRGRGQRPACLGGMVSYPRWS